MINFVHDIRSLKQIARDAKRMFDSGSTRLASLELANQLIAVLSASKADLLGSPLPTVEDAPITGEELAKTVAVTLKMTSELGDTPAPLRRTMAVMADVLKHCIDNDTGLAGMNIYYAKEGDAIAAVAELGLLAKQDGVCDCVMCAVTHFIEKAIPEDARDRAEAVEVVTHEVVNAVEKLFSDDSEQDEAKPKGSDKPKPTMH